MEEIKFLIVIGASAGGLKAATSLIHSLPEKLPVAIVVVLHMGKRSSPEIIISQFAKNTAYSCGLAKDGEPIKLGHIYLAPPDYHIFVKQGSLRLTKGPHENRWRPSIDVLFRSAAAAYDSKLIGIILSGMMDDGTSGMSAIKRSGGTCIVQEPEEAEFEDMPVNVLNNVEVDYQVPVADINYILADILSKPQREHLPIPEDVKIEANITERMVSSISDMEKIGHHSNYACPDCGGNLWKVNDEAISRYRCHTGHVYTIGTLLEKQGEELEESLWVSIRMLEERKNLLIMMAGDDKYTGMKEEQQRRATQISVHIERLKALLILMSKRETNDEGYL